MALTDKKKLLKVALDGWNRSLVARISKCGWAITLIMGFNMSQEFFFVIKLKNDIIILLKACRYYYLQLYLLGPPKHCMTLNI